MNDHGFAPIRTEWDDRIVEQAVDEAIALKLISVRKSSMKLGPYNGFDGAARVLSDWKIKIAIDMQLIPRPSKCSVCDKATGRIDYHAENYGRPLLVAPICQGCHMALHNVCVEPGTRRVGKSALPSTGMGPNGLNICRNA